jgi:hypothetical protein
MDVTLETFDHSIHRPLQELGILVSSTVQSFASYSIS